MTGGRRIYRPCRPRSAAEELLEALGRARGWPGPSASPSSGPPLRAAGAERRAGHGERGVGGRGAGCRPPAPGRPPPRPRAWPGCRSCPSCAAAACPCARPPPMPGMPGMPGMPARRRAASCFIIFWASVNRSSSWLTSDTVTPGPAGDAGPARAVDLLGVGALERRHRADHRLDAVELALVEVVELLAHLAHARHHPEHRLQRAHLLDGRHLLQEVVEGEVLLGEELARHLLAWPRSKACSACSIRVRTSPMSRMREAIRSGWKTSKSSTFSPVEANMIGRPVTVAHRQRRATAGVAVELGQDDTGEVDALLERLGRLDRGLADHRVDDEQHLVGLDRVADVGGLLHEVLRRRASRPAVSTMTTSCWRARACSMPARPPRPGRRTSGALTGSTPRRPPTLPRSGANTRHAGPLADHLQLVDGVRALQVGRDQHRRVALVLEPARRACRPAWSYPSPAGRRA